MVSTPPAESISAQLDRLIDGLDPDLLQDFLDTLPALEVARYVSRLSDERRAELLAVLDPDDAASVVEQLPDVQAVDVLELLEPRVAASILHEIPAEQRADLLGDVEQPVAEAILSAMEAGDAADTRTLGSYEDDVAGGLMTLEYLGYAENRSVADVLKDLRESAELYREFVVQYVFVTTKARRLVGVLRLRDLLFAGPNVRLRDLMLGDPHSILDTAPLDEARAFFDRHSFFGAPVVDAAGRLVGLIRRSAVNEALAEQSDSAFLKTQGIVGGEELRSMPLLQRSARRLSWLSVNIVLNVVAASVIAAHQETLAAVIALAVFLPIISDMSGCSGNQAVAVSLRELSLGLLQPSEIGRVWFKEISVGCINGLALGTLIALVAWAWQGNPFLGLVVGIAMTVNTVVAVSIGGTVPLLLRRFKMDPALASGPILTTVTDMCGFLLLLGVASRMLPRLAGS